ncbi:leukocyte surface antigen CD53 [Bombyx mori]|uniref:Tetraspanin n=1 Tax=Bombyx mori TaxID=7091 RepID=A0A8R2QYD8_BOMMO|nr:leukocyte surface antigen CD53 [Bombyx mori]
MTKMSLKLNLEVPKFLKSVRYTLAAVNGLFLLTGFLLLIVGVVILVQYSEYEVFVTQRFFTIPGFVIATGVIICIGSILGFYGAISEQFYFIAGYVMLSIVVLVFEIVIIIIAFALSNDAVSEIRAPMLQSHQLYESRRDIARLWDDLQMEFECCGVSSRLDYMSSRIPVSCCHIDYGTISPFECGAANAYTTGCATFLGEWLAYNAYVIAVCAIVATSLQVLLSAMSGWLAYRSKFEEVELES